MKMKVNLRSSNQTFRPSFGQIIQVDDGGYERGYAAGHEEGFASGHEEGFAAGESSGSGGFPIGDGNTHIWIHLEEGRTSPVLGVCPNGTVTVDWGDGTEPDILTGTSTGSTKFTPSHYYEEPGDYVITLTVDGEMGIKGMASYYTPSLLRESSTGDTPSNNHYASKIAAVECGKNVSIGAQAFWYCYGLEKVIINEGVTTINTSAFDRCYTLNSIILPESVTSIGKTAFYGCYGLATLFVPKNVESIGREAFAYCGGLSFIDFSKHTFIPTLDSYAFNRVSGQIRVPAPLVDEWKAATNWSDLANYIVGV